MPAARALYEGVCGWRSERIEAGGGSYLALDMGNGFGGGIVECETRRSLWLPYVEVARSRRLRAGARHRRPVLLEPREGPDGWRAVVATSAGAELALWQPKR